jgi:hypothetical protein
LIADLGRGPVALDTAVFIHFIEQRDPGGDLFQAGACHRGEDRRHDREEPRVLLETPVVP